MKRRLFTLITLLLSTLPLFGQVDPMNYIPAELSDTPDVDYIYRLPYELGIKATAVRINHIEANHLPPDNLVNFRAYEFRFKEPTSIYASRSGRVLFAEWPVIRIQHADGSIAEYSFFAEGSIYVEVGDEVTTGDKLCESGKSNYSDNENVIAFELYHKMRNDARSGFRARVEVLNHYLDPLFRSQRGVKPLRDMKRYKAKEVK